MIRIFGHDAGHAAAFAVLKVELEVNSDAIEFGLRRRAKLASPGRACARELAYLVGDLYPIVLISILPHVRCQDPGGHRWTWHEGVDIHFVIDQCGPRSGIARIALQRLSQITDRA